MMPLYFFLEDLLVFLFRLRMSGNTLIIAGTDISRNDARTLSNVCEGTSPSGYRKWGAKSKTTAMKDTPTANHHPNMRELERRDTCWADFPDQLAKPARTIELVTNQTPQLSGGVHEPKTPRSLNASTPNSELSAFSMPTVPRSIGINCPSLQTYSSVVGACHLSRTPTQSGVEETKAPRATLNPNRTVNTH